MVLAVFFIDGKIWKFSVPLHTGFSLVFTITQFLLLLYIQNSKIWVIVKNIKNPRYTYTLNFHILRSIKNNSQNHRFNKILQHRPNHLFVKTIYYWFIPRVWN